MLNEYERIAGYNTEIVYVSPEDLEHTREYLQRGKIDPAAVPFPVVLDADRSLVKAHRLEKPAEKRAEVFPSMILIDTNGMLRFRYVGLDNYDRPPIEHLEEMLGVVSGR